MGLKVLISTSTFAEASRLPLDKLKEHDVEYQLNPWKRKLRPDEISQLIVDVNGLLAGTELLNRDVLAHGRNLIAISRVGVGIENVDLEAAEARGIGVAYTVEAHIDSVAELALGGILNVLRHVSLSDRKLRAGEWIRPMGCLLREQTVGIVGLGRVGKALVKLLQPFNVRIIAYDPRQDAVFADRYGIKYVPLDDLLQCSDIVSLHLSYSKDAHFLIDTARLALMKPTAILVNVARGGLIDETALHTALVEKRIASAYIDTFDQEPYEGPLAALPNVLLTPHIGSYAAECRIQMEMEAVDNLLHIFEEKGYL